VTNEDSVLEEAMDNLREAAQCIRATQNLMHARGMTEDAHYRELLTPPLYGACYDRGGVCGGQEEARLVA
jgi:hypothetical protein